MTRGFLPLAALAALGLGGCAAGLAAGALGAAVNAARPQRVIAEDLRQAAVAACTARAAPEGEVRIIDPERHPDGRVTVWGTVEADGRRRSFECRYDGEITAFRLREIRAR